MSITFALELNNRPNKRGAYAINLRITQFRKHKRVRTSIEVKRTSDFNKATKNEKWIRPSEPNHADWNDILRKDLENAKQKYRELKEEGLANTNNIVGKIKAGEMTASFLKYAKERTQEVYDAGNYRNWKKYNGFCNKLTAFLRDKRSSDLTFAELTPSLLSKFEFFLSTLNNQQDATKRLHPNTIVIIFNIFKTILKRAIQIDGLLKPEKNPFLVYSYKGVKTTKEKLDNTEINAIIALDLDPNSIEWHCRNYFLFSFYCAGIRAGDLIQLRWCNITPDKRLSYQMGKNHKTRDLILVKQAQEILSHYYRKEAKSSDYIFPLLDASEEYAKAITQKDIDTLPTILKVKLYNKISVRNNYINKYLKKIAELANINKKISLHISRHSFARIAKSKGTDNSIVQGLLAHSSIKVTELYMGEFDTSTNDTALNNIFSQEEVKTPKIIQNKELISLLSCLNREQVEALLNQLKQQQLESRCL